MKVMFDTNVILDLLLTRPPHAELAARLLDLADNGKIKGLLCATTVTTIYYLGTKVTDRRKAERYVRELLVMFKVAPVDHAILAHALALDFPDYEDAVLHESARAAGAVGIVTRNRKDFAAASLSIFDPAELLSAALSAE